MLSEQKILYIYHRVPHRRYIYWSEDVVKIVNVANAAAKCVYCWSNLNQFL